MNYILHTIIKLQARVYFFILLFACSKFEISAFGSSLIGDENETNDKVSDSVRSLDIFRTEIRNSDYENALIKLLSVSESKGGVRFNPEFYPIIGIKIKTQMSPGLQVSKKFLDAVLDILEFRGYGLKQVFITDRDRNSLVQSGIYSFENGNAQYRGYNVYSSVDEDYFSKEWFHDSPMPPTLHDRTRFFIDFPFDRFKRVKEERKSYLPSLLFLKNTFWINLAVASDSVNLGIDGASSNITTGAISNYQRFLDRKTIAPAAVTEILAIPEFWEKRTYSIIDLSRYQFSNGGQFDAEFISGKPILLLSENPFSVDRIALSFLNDERKKKGFSLRLEEDVLMFKYASEIGLGDVKKAKVFNIK